MRSLVVVLCLVVLTACVPVEMGQKPNPEVTVHCVYPVIVPLPQTQELQKKGGINVSVAASTFTCADAYRDSFQEVPSLFDFQAIMELQKMIKNGAGGTEDDYMRVETTRTPVAAVTPDRIVFKVKFNNQMPRVFRGAGTVVLYKVGGKNVSVKSDDYAELTSLIVPPRSEQEINILGPSIKDIQPGAIIALSLYDVVTNTDNAGNIKEKENFEWLYNFSTQSQDSTRSVVTSKSWMRKPR